jgi:hypothetical protein
MDWVKRNLAFVVGSGMAVGLMLFSGFYLYSNSQKNNDAREQLEGEYKELKRLHQLKPHPGKGDVDNIQLAQEQRESLVTVIERVGEQLAPIAPIPPSTNVSGEEFSAALRRTIDELSREARYSSVILPTNYNFSFEAEKRLVKFAPGSLSALSVQLGEVKAISEVLFAAKVNKLTGLRRERVSPDDMSGPRSDYTTKASITNELAIVSPYEVSFESFSAELAEVISGFANSPHGMVIKGLNIQPAKAAPTRGSRYGLGAAGGGEPIYSAPVTQVYPDAGMPDYGQLGGEIGTGYVGDMGRYGGGGAGNQIRRPTFNRPTFGDAQASPYEAPPTYRAQPTYAQPTRGYPTGVAPTGASQTLIDEHPLAVTMVVEVIKVLPPQEDY